MFKQIVYVVISIFVLLAVVMLLNPAFGEADRNVDDALNQFNDPDGDGVKTLTDECPCTSNNQVRNPKQTIGNTAYCTAELDPSRFEDLKDNVDNVERRSVTRNDTFYYLRSLCTDALAADAWPLPQDTENSAGEE